ncbi:hypothetical protein CRUP_001143 [Coryphaenoides rupestris]|nr:hypothetical protein CRUP_001143 [Coryphaenoides rupestris]
MQWKLLSVSLVLLIQACGHLMAQSPSPPAAEPPGFLGTLAERARDAATNVQAAGGLVREFAGFYYDENIKPVTDSYWDWASATTDTMWERVQKTIDHYRPSQSNQTG